MSRQLVCQAISLREAKEYVALHHRHHRPPIGHKFSLGVYTTDGRLCGVGIIGRPVARLLDDGTTLEVTRTATDGTRNANSCLYGAARREAARRGYRKLITYTMDFESGASLRGAGWTLEATLKPRRGWSCPSRPRNSWGVDYIGRLRWAINLTPPD